MVIPWETAAPIFNFQLLVVATSYVIRQTNATPNLHESFMAQSLAKVFLHVIFSTKHREPTILPTWRNELYRVLGGLANTQGCQSLLVGGVSDHVHMLFQLGRTISIADILQQIKSRSSCWVNETRGLPSEFHWQSGYGAFSVSYSKVASVLEYIRRQPEHHHSQTFQDEFRKWLQKYEIEWDERYVWD